MEEKQEDWLETVGLTGNVEESQPPEDDTESPDSAEKTAPEPQAETPPPQKEEPPKEDPRLRELGDKVANLEKRLHDTQAALTRSRQEAKAKEEAEARENDDESGWFDEDDGTQTSDAPPAETKDSELKTEVETLKAEQARMLEREALRRWNEAEIPSREKHSDYADVVDKGLIPAINKQDARSQYLMSEFQRLGATPEAAYEVGSMLRRMEGGGDAPGTDNGRTAQESRMDAPDWNSEPPSGGGYDDGRSPLDEVLSEMRR